MKKTYFTFYKGKDKQWRWRAKRNGRIVADSSEGYHNKNDCMSALQHLIESIVKDNLVFRRG